MGIRRLFGRKHLWNIILAVIAAGVMVFYATCTTSCSYLKGDILGLDLKYAGMIFMALIIILSIAKKDLFLSLLLSAGIGAEVILVSFQVRNDVYCPYCLTFGAILVILFLLNVNLSRKWVMALFFILGLAAFLIFFRGSAIPTYTV
jgi:hypothetical protein